MKTVKLRSMSAVPFAALLLAACGQPATEGSSAAGADDAPGTQQSAANAAREHTAEGTLNSFDRDAGTVNISHGPVASARWPAMTMNFKLADPSQGESLTPGQKVEFDFTIESGMSATVTKIAPAE
jgi:Cu(I)/Ag(I) efflux system membrane fusion protein